MKKKLNKIAKDTNIFLKRYLKSQKKSDLIAPMIYGLLPGGKKIRSKILVDVGKIFKVKYNICNKCGHLNGIYEDTKTFVNWLYSSSDGSNYKKQYMDNFAERVENIYISTII